MFKLITATVAAGLFSVAAYAAQEATMQRSIPQSAVTVTDWYKQNVYDPSNNKIGEVMDVLVDKVRQDQYADRRRGRFSRCRREGRRRSVRRRQPTMKDKKMWLVMNTTKDSLKSAPGFKYDSNSTTWVPDHKM